ncbi:MAG: histidine--tRNA ligase [Candidatus Rokubacteria bacterium]|nr:histidine--tRNA ligase [Candidatus Rokubacteria bacterium]
MSDRVPTTPPTGMRDVLPDEVELRDRAVQTILAVYRGYGFRRIETPALESLRLLTSGEGGENEKLIFKVLKRGDELRAARERGDELADLGLRFDLTVPLARYYAQNHAKLPNPLKAIQIGPVWRAERPQRGRFRQFTQCDIDVLGVGGPVVEVELVLATSEALVTLGLSELTVRLNDRRILAAIARACGFDDARRGGFFIAFDKLDKVGPAGVIRELREAGHDAAAVATFESLLASLDPAHATIDHVMAAVTSVASPDVTSSAAALRAIIDAVAVALPPGCQVRFDPTLVRGMGYYTGPIFEIAAAGYPSSIAGGGRYDRMIGKLLGRDVPASGFSIGFERLISILGERPAGAAAAEAVGERIALLIDDPDADLAGPVSVAQRLRRDGRLVSLEVRRKNWKKQAEDLAAHGFAGWVRYNDGEPWRVRSLARPD